MIQISRNLVMKGDTLLVNPSLAKLDACQTQIKGGVKNQMPENKTARERNRGWTH